MALLGGGGELMIVPTHHARVGLCAEASARGPDLPVLLKDQLVVLGVTLDDQPPPVERLLKHQRVGPRLAV